MCGEAACPLPAPQSARRSTGVTPRRLATALLIKPHKCRAKNFSSDKYEAVLHPACVSGRREHAGSTNTRATGGGKQPPLRNTQGRRGGKARESAWQEHCRDPVSGLRYPRAHVKAPCTNQHGYPLPGGPRRGINVMLGLTLAMGASSKALSPSFLRFFVIPFLKPPKIGNRVGIDVFP